MHETKKRVPGRISGEKYDSLSELSEDLELPYSPLMHKYYRTKDVDKAVKIAQRAKEAETYVVWGRKYKSVSMIANEYGIKRSTIFKKWSRETR